MKFNCSFQMCTCVFITVVVVLFQSQASTCNDFIILRLSHKLSPSSPEFTHRGVIITNSCNPQSQHVLSQNDLSDAERMELTETAKEGKNYVIMWRTDCGRVEGVSYASARSLLDSNLADQFVIIMDFNTKRFPLISYTIGTASTESPDHLTCTGFKFCTAPKSFNTSVIGFQTSNRPDSCLDWQTFEGFGKISLMVGGTALGIGFVLTVLVSMFVFCADIAGDTWRTWKRHSEQQQLAVKW